MVSIHVYRSNFMKWRWAKKNYPSFHHPETTTYSISLQILQVPFNAWFIIFWQIVICHIAKATAICNLPLNKWIHFEIFLTKYTNATLLFFKMVLAIFPLFLQMNSRIILLSLKIPLVFRLWEIWKIGGEFIPI